MGTKFTVYDHGVSPAKAQGLLEKAHARQELAAVCYVSATPPRALPRVSLSLRLFSAAGIVVVPDGFPPSVALVAVLVCLAASALLVGLPSFLPTGWKGQYTAK